MAGFEWNELYTAIKIRIENAVSCTVGRYVTPKESMFPYVDISLADNSGGNYTLEGNEASQRPLIVVTVYSTGSMANPVCENISQVVKKIMLSYGFQCRGGIIPVPNAADPNICRWVGRYQRTIADGDKVV